MITIRNTQRKVNLNLEEFKTIIQKTIKFLGYPDYDLGIWITNNKRIRAFNKKYRKKNKATDVLSFPYHVLRPGEDIQIKNSWDRNLGDIIISAEYIKSELNDKFSEKRFLKRLKILLVHGVCHLLGYTHENFKNFEKMQKKELAILNFLKKNL